MSVLSFHQATARLHELVAQANPDPPLGPNRTQVHSVAHEIHHFLSLLTASPGGARPPEPSGQEGVLSQLAALTAEVVLLPHDSRRGQRRAVRVLAVHAIHLARFLEGVQGSPRGPLVLTFLRYVLEGSLSLQTSEDRLRCYHPDIEKAIADHDPARLGYLLEQLYRLQSPVVEWAGRLRVSLAVRGYVCQRHRDMVPACYLGGAVVGIAFLGFGLSPLAGFGLGFVAVLLFAAACLAALPDELEHDPR